MESWADTLETIPGTWRGGEAYPRRGFGIPPEGRTIPRVPLLSSATASSAVTDTPYMRRSRDKVRLSAFRTLFVYHRSCRAARWSGKRVVSPCAPCWPCLRLGRTRKGYGVMPIVVVAPEARYLNGKQQE